MRKQWELSSVRLWQRRLFLSVVLCIQTIYLSLIDVFNTRIPGAEIISPWAAFISFVLSTIAVLYLGASFISSTMRGLRDRIFNMDSLVTIGTVTAYLYSWLSYILYIIQEQTILTNTTAAPYLYFNTVIYLFTFVTLGKWLEARATNKAEQSVRQLITLRPREAHLINGGNVVNIPSTKIKIGDHLLVNAGETIPVDGRVVSGEASINESMITGESSAQDKHIGSQVIAGTISNGGEIEIVAERIGENTMLARIIQLIKNAQTARTPIETITDRISSVFVPFVIMIAMLTFAVWYFYVGVDMSSAMIMFVTVVMVACPCAFGLASPSAVTVGIGIGSKNGILIKGSNALQQLAKIDTVVFDKTGTLTNGELVVTDIIALNGSAKECLTIASSLERYSDHSLAKAIITRADSQHLEAKVVKKYETIAGYGINGQIGKIHYYLGNDKLVEKYSTAKLPDTAKLTKAGKTVCYLFTSQKVLAVIAVADQPKPNAAQTIRQLHKMKIRTVLLSGDSSSVSNTIAKRLGIKNVIAGVMPDGKATEVLKLRQDGHRVAMVGDGINDAPAIASANVGVAIGTGTDAAIETGDIVLVSGDPLALCAAIRLSKITTSKIHQNMFFSLFYNVISIPLAAGALSYFGISLQPELAGLIMAMSSVAIIVNSLTLKLANINKQHEIGHLIAPLILFLLFTIAYTAAVFN